MANFTEKAIKASFIKLINEKPMNRISVREIVEDCGINRNSFYYHFRDIPALAECIITDFFNELIAEYPNVTSLGDCFNAAFCCSLKNKKAMLHIYNSVRREIFENYLMKFCEYVVTLYLNTAFSAGITAADRKLIIRFLKCQLFGAYIDWMNSGMPESTVDEIKRILSVCRGLSEEIIERCIDIEEKETAAENTAANKR